MSHYRCLQKEMTTYRHWSVSLWRDPDDVPHCRILSPDKTEWRLISATLCGWRRCFVADQSGLWHAYEKKFDCITDYFLYLALEATCAAYASLNLSLLHYITDADRRVLYNTAKHLITECILFVVESVHSLLSWREISPTRSLSLLHHHTITSPVNTHLQITSTLTERLCSESTNQKVIRDSNPDCRIWMCVGSLPKCCGFIIFSPSVILPRWLYENC